MLPSDDELVRRIDVSPGRKTRDLARDLDLGDEGQEELLRRLLALQRRGLVIRLPLEGWNLTERTEFRVGTFRPGRRRGSTVRVAAGTPREEDLHVLTDRSGGAFAGDLVLVRLERARRLREPGPMRAATVVDVLERGRRLVRGRFHGTRGGGVVQVEVAGEDAAIFVPTADRGAARDGEEVLVRVLDAPGARGRVRGKVVVTSAEEGSLSGDLAAVREIFDLPEEHPAACEKEAARLEATADGRSWPGRLDLRDREVFTIDPIDARDFDDAVSIEPLEEGRTRLGVHIADVSHFVRPGGAIDEEAESRGTSVYFPGRALHMLPRRISEDLASLAPSRDRLTKSVLMTFGRDGSLESHEISRSVIRSSRRFTYEEVLSILGEPRAGGREGSLPPDHARFEGPLRRMATLRDLLRRRRLERGALELEVPRLRLETDSSGRVTGLGADRRDPARSLIEEFMLAANESVATWLIDRKLPILARVHEPPDPEKVEDLRALLAALDIALPAALDAAAVGRVLSKLEGSALSDVVQLEVLKTMEHAAYSAGRGIHFALATDRYCHFTSPIRRYPDLILHQIIDEHLDGAIEAPGRRKHWNDRLPLLAERTSASERRAEEAEREMTKLRLARYLQPFVGRQMRGSVVSVHPFGVFVRIRGTLVDGMVPVSSLTDDYYAFDPERRTLQGERTRRRLCLGDDVGVELRKVDVDLREITFRLLDVRERSGPRGPEREATSRPERPRKERRARKGRSAPHARRGKGRRGAR